MSVKLLAWSNNSLWLSATAPVCEWYGVECTGPNVTTLTLRGNAASGMLPTQLALLRSLREGGQRTPVLLLSALGSVDDRVQGLHCERPSQHAKRCIRISHIPKPKVADPDGYSGAEVHI